MNQLKIIILSLILTACSFPQFSFKSGGSETKEIDAETVQVDYFDNKSAIGGSFVSEPPDLKLNWGSAHPVKIILANIIFSLFTYFKISNSLIFL